MYIVLKLLDTIKFSFRRVNKIFVRASKTVHIREVLFVFPPRFILDFHFSIQVDLLQLTAISGVGLRTGGDQPNDSYIEVMMQYSDTDGNWKVKKNYREEILVCAKYTQKNVQKVQPKAFNIGFIYFMKHP